MKSPQFLLRVQHNVDEIQLNGAYGPNFIPTNARSPAQEVYISLRKT